MQLICQHTMSRSEDMFRDHFIRSRPSALQVLRLHRESNQACGVLLCRSVAIASFEKIMWRAAQERLK